MFVDELEFALRLHRLWRDDQRSRSDKLAMARVMHRSFARRHLPATRRRCLAHERVIAQQFVPLANLDI